MGEELLTSSERDGGAPTENPAVDPKCPACTYDLRGLGAGPGSRLTCPECGGAFTYEEVTRPRKRRIWEDVSPESLVCVVALLIVWTLVVPETAPCFPPVLLWPLVLWWGVLARRKGRPMLGFSVGAAVVVAGSSTLMVERVGLTAVSVVLFNAFPLMAWAALWAAEPKPVFAGSTLMLALIPGVPAFALLLAWGAAYSNGDYWTNWNVSFPGESARWEMGRDGALREGLVLLGVTVVILGAGWVVCRCAAREPDQR